MKLRQISSLALVAASAGLVLLSLPSCSVIVNDFKEQCQTTQDCIDLIAKQPLGPDGKPVSGLVCSDRHVCEPGKGCHSNVECQDAHDGQPYICRASDRTCQSLVLKSPDDPNTTICDVLADPAFREPAAIAATTAATAATATSTSAILRCTSPKLPATGSLVKRS